MTLDSDLPDELLQAAGQEEPRLSQEDLAAQYKKLQELGTLIGGKRTAAVKARKESGIEDVWTACEEAYARIDESNRSESAGGQPWRKPTSSTGPLTRATGKEAEARSNVYIPLTTRYVDMAAAKAKEKALPIGGMPFQIDPSPTPDLVDIVKHPAAATPPVPQAAPGAPPVPGAPANPQTPAAQAAEQVADTARTSADKAAKRIWDWWEEAKYSKHIRRVIDDGARIGVGVLKGPFPDGKTQRALSEQGDKATLEIVQKTFPGLTWVDPWNLFPAGNCGEDVHDGDHILERSYMSEGRLRALKDLREPGGDPIYLGDQIEKVIEEGPEKCNYDADGRRKNEDVAKGGMYQVWQYTGQMTREDMIALKALGAEDLPSEVVYCHAIVTLVNDTVVRAQFNPLEKTGRFPYRIFCWSRRAGHWAGVGVGEQVSVPQKMVNAATRAWMNNAGVSSGVQLIFDASKLRPADNSPTIGGGIKQWETTADAAGADVRTLMTAITIPNMGVELKAIVDYAFQLAEEMSNIPLVSQGHDGPTTPQTFGQAELQNSNGNTLLRQIADNLDSEVIEPLVDDYYEWLLSDDDVPDEEKGDFQIIATGCKAMVERVIQEQSLIIFGQMALNPAYEMNPANVAKLIAESKRIDPARLRYTDAELAKIHSQPTPEAPAVTAAKINAATKVHVQDMADQAQLRQVQAESKHEQELLQSGGTTPHGARAMSLLEAARIKAASAENIENSRAFAERERAEKELEIARQNGQFKIAELQLQKEIALLQYSTQQKISLDDTKAQLAKSAMDNETKRQLASAEIQLAQSEGHADRTVDLHKHATSLQRDEISTPDTP